MSEGEGRGSGKEGEGGADGREHRDTVGLRAMQRMACTVRHSTAVLTAVPFRKFLCSTIVVCSAVWAARWKLVSLCPLVCAVLALERVSRNTVLRRLKMP